MSAVTTQLVAGVRLSDAAMIAGVVEAIALLVADGVSITEIGARLGLTKGQVSGLKRRHLDGKPERMRPLPPSAPTPEPPRGCQYPLSSSRPWVFCGAAVDAPGSPWCAAHRRICYAGRGSWAAA